MAYPTLSSYWLGKSRKDLAERAIVARRDQEAQRHKRLNSVAQYYHNIDVQSARYRALENPTPSSALRWNEESSKQKLLKEEKQHKLQERRRKLTALLKAETDKFEAEMKMKQKEARMKDPWKLDDLKQQIEDIRKKREEARKKTSEKEEMILKWKHTPHIKQLDAKLLQQEVLRAWKEKQNKEEMEELKRLEEEDKKRNEQLEEQKRDVERELALMTTRRKEEAERCIAQIDQQKEQVKNEVKQSETLKTSEVGLLQKISLIDDIKAKRVENKASRDKRELMIALMRLPKDKLRKKAFEIQQELESDQNALDMLKAHLIVNHSMEGNVAKIKDDFLRVQQTIKKQLAAEKSKQIEIQTLYQEEAAKCWWRFENEWSQQRETREELMNKILDEMKRFIQGNLAQNLKSQEESLEKRDVLLKSLEELSEKDKDDEEQCLREKEKYEESIKTLESSRTPRSSRLPAPSRPLPWPWWR